MRNSSRVETQKQNQKRITHHRLKVRGAARARLGKCHSRTLVGANYFILALGHRDSVFVAILSGNLFVGESQESARDTTALYFEVVHLLLLLLCDGTRRRTNHGYLLC